MLNEEKEEFWNDIAIRANLFDCDLTKCCLIQGNGYIPVSALKEILRELDNKLTDEELDGIIYEIDEDGSGTVDFDEFMDMMTGWRIILKRKSRQWFCHKTCHSFSFLSLSFSGCFLEFCYPAYDWEENETGPKIKTYDKAAKRTQKTEEDIIEVQIKIKDFLPISCNR